MNRGCDTFGAREEEGCETLEGSSVHMWSRDGRVVSDRLR